MTSSIPDLSDLLTSNEVAAILRISPHTLAVWRLQGSGPPLVKIGRRILYEPAAIMEVVRDRTYKSTSEYSQPKPCINQKKTIKRLHPKHGSRVGTS